MKEPSAHEATSTPGPLMAGMQGVILGVANDHSLAWACARECMAHGARIAFSHLGEAQLKRLRDLVPPDSGSLVIPCDVRKDEDIANFFAQVRQEFGRIDFLIHSIAYTDRECLRQPLYKTSRAHFAMTLDISTYSFLAVAREAAALMWRGGSMITLSYYGAEKVVPGYNVMGVAKAALECSVRYLAEELGPGGIRVNSISAGAVSTLSASAIPRFPRMLAVSEQASPLRRNITAGEVGRTALFLLSGLGTGITGETLHVDAGFHALGISAPLD